MHVVVDAGGGAQVGSLLALLHLSALAQFAGSKDGDGLSLAHALVGHQFVDGHLAQGVQVVVAVAQYLLHEVDGTDARRSRTDEDGKQLGIAEAIGTTVAQLLARSVLFGPLVYV